MSISNINEFFLIVK